MMIFIAFFNIRHWHTFAYVFYFLIILLLLYVSFFGLKASGSQRWMDLYLFVLQPSELMKIAVILCLSKYYHRIKIENENTNADKDKILLLIYICNSSATIVLIRFKEFHKISG